MAKRYQRVIRSSRKAKNGRQCNIQKIPKGNQKERKAKNERKYNGQKIPMGNQK